MEMFTRAGNVVLEKMLLKYWQRATNNSLIRCLKKFQAVLDLSKLAKNEGEKMKAN